MVPPEYGHSRYVETLSQLEALGCSAARAARVVLHEGRSQRGCQVERWYRHRSFAGASLSDGGDRLDRPESRPTLCKVRSENPGEAVHSARPLSSLWVPGLRAAVDFMDFAKPNHSMQRIGASRSRYAPFLHQRWLTPTADAGRSAEMHLDRPVFGFVLFGYRRY